MLNQYGYDTSPPNPPYHMRDVLNKCEDCGRTWVGMETSRHCGCKPEGRTVENNIARNTMQIFDRMFGFNHVETEHPVIEDEQSLTLAAGEATCGIDDELGVA